MLVELALAERDSKDAGVFFFLRSFPIGRPWSQAFLAETVKTGNKNLDDFRRMQISLVMSMQFNMGDDWSNAQCLSRSSLAKFFFPCKKSRRLRFMLIWNSKVKKSEVQNRQKKGKTAKNTCSRKTAIFNNLFMTFTCEKFNTELNVTEGIVL